MRVMEVGTKALSAGNTRDAYDLFNKSYELYSLFWGINMDLIDLTGVKKIAPDVYAQCAADTEKMIWRSYHPKVQVLRNLNPLCVVWGIGCAMQ